jgi:hypothetical protein
LEWFLLDKIEHLWREDCNEAALRNVLLGDKDSSVVSLEFSDADLNSSKTLGPNLKTATDNNSAGFKSFLEKAATERIFLRNAQITNIVAKTKGEKREWIAKSSAIGIVDWAIQWASDTRKHTRRRAIAQPAA